RLTLPLPPQLCFWRCKVTALVVFQRKNDDEEKSMRDFDARIAAMARAQLGHFTRAHARSCGMTDRMCRHRLATGQWEEVHPTVYKLAGLPPTWEGRALAACFTHPCGLAASVTAAHLYGLNDFGAVGIIDVLVPRHTRPVSHPGIRYHESLVHDLANPTTRR